MLCKFCNLPNDDRMNVLFFNGINQGMAQMGRMMKDGVVPCKAISIGEAIKWSVA